MNSLIPEFYSLLEQSAEHTGIQLPDTVVHYLALLLADRVKKPVEIPPLGFGAEYLTMMSDPQFEPIRNFADRVLFCAGVYPERLTRRGASITYFQDLDATAYQCCAEISGVEVFDDLARAVPAGVVLISHTVGLGGGELVKFA